MKEEPKHFYEFGPFRVDPDKRLLLRDDRPVPLQPKAFEMLLVLVQKSGTVVLKDDLMKALWPDSFVEESNLTQHIFVLRKSLGETAGENRYIATVPGRGYQFAEQVRLVPEQEEIVVRNHSVTQVVIDAGQTEIHPRAVPATQVRTTNVFGWIGFVVLVLAALFVGGWYWRSHRTIKLAETDTIVLTDFANSTGDPIFDDTLKTALTISLRQSPFLNVLPNSQVAKTLRLMTRPADSKLTPDLAREVCQRAGSKVYVAGSIGSLGVEYVLGLKAVNCQTGGTLAKEQVTAASKEKVVSALGEAAYRLRGEMGESLSSVQKFDLKLEEFTTPSLGALKAYSLGVKANRQKGPAAAIPDFQHSIELDPNFALGYLAVGDNYIGLGELGRASVYFTKAFQLKEHASERERLFINSAYYSHVTGELDKAAQAFQEQTEINPRDSTAYDSLASVLGKLGEYEKASDIIRLALRIRPDEILYRESLLNYTVALQHFDQARQIIQEAQAQKQDDVELRNVRYAFAFLAANSAEMAEHLQWFAAKPQYENVGFALASDTEAYAGHVRKARELTKRSVESAIRTDSKETGAIWQAIAAQREAAFGNAVRAKQAATAAIKLVPESQGVEVEATLAFAMAGDTARAESMTQDLGKRFPLDTQVQSLWLPAIQAQLAVNAKNPAVAINTLHVGPPIELGSTDFALNVSCLYTVYVRGEAYLAAGQGSAAAAEFQGIIDHNGMVWNCWTGALAHLGVARANALQFRASQGAEADAARVRALAAYADFLTLWKDADPDVPILKEAQAEYSKLQLQ
jgi:DNA-binding winged helix-turn-helix (wHTH) protein/tetratricopeptide (TPR) repeat protein